jgi:ribosome-associated heat shock protein Hsp15
VAQSLYSETPASIQAREAAQAQRIFHTEPAHSISGGRPSKKDRRDMNQMQTAPQWDARWSAKAEN